MKFDDLTRKKIRHHMTTLEWIRYDMAEDKAAYIQSFCSQKLGVDSLGIRSAVGSVFNYFLRRYDTNTIYKGDGLERYIKTRDGTGRASIDLDR